MHQFSSENLAQPTTFHRFVVFNRNYLLESRKGFFKVNPLYSVSYLFRPGERRFGDLPSAKEIAQMKAKEEAAKSQINEHEDSLKKQREIAADIAKNLDRNKVDDIFLSSLGSKNGL